MVNMTKFLRNWILLNAAFIIIGYILMVLFGILMMEITNISMSEWPSPLEQTIWQIGNAILFGSSIGFIQWRLLRKTYSIPSSWIYLVPAGMVLTELVAGILLWEMGINRGEFAFWENNPIPHALIASIYGLIIGLFQFSIIRRHFFKGAFWILASTLAWGVSIILTAINVTNDIFLLITFVIGILVYGLMTGGVLMWILKPRKSE
jgi:hypothetical protein